MLVQSLQPRKLLLLLLRRCFGSLYFSWQCVFIVSDANIRHENDIVFAPRGSKSRSILKIQNKKFVFFDYLIVFFRFHFISKLLFQKNISIFYFFSQKPQTKKYFQCVRCSFLRVLEFKQAFYTFHSPISIINSF